MCDLARCVNLKLRGKAVIPARKSFSRQNGLHAIAAEARAHTSRRAVLLALPAPILTLPRAANAKESILGVYNSAAEKYDELDDGQLARFLGLSQLRQQLIGRAYGEVLEVAVGTGINLPIYHPGKLGSYTGLDLSPGMLFQAETKLQGLPLARIARLEEGDVEMLPYEDSRFDCVISTYSLCVFRNPALALREMARVVKPGGKVLLLEHSRSDFGPLAWYQDVTVAAVTAISKGCVWNQNLDILLGEAGLRVTSRASRLAGLVQLMECCPQQRG